MKEKRKERIKKKQTKSNDSWKAVNIQIFLP